MPGNRRRHRTGPHKRHFNLQLPSRKDWQRSWRNLRAARHNLIRLLARSKRPMATGLGQESGPAPGQGSRQGVDKYSGREPISLASAPGRQIARGRIPRAVWRNLVFVYLFVFLAAVGFAMGRLAPQLLVNSPSRFGVSLLRFLDWGTGAVVPLATTFFDGQGNAAKEILETAIPAMAVVSSQGKVSPPSLQVVARDLIRSVTSYDLGDPRSFFVSGLSSVGSAGSQGLPARGGPGRGGPQLPGGGMEMGPGRKEGEPEEGGPPLTPEISDTARSGASGAGWQEARPGPVRETAPVQINPSALWAKAAPSEAAALFKEETVLVRKLAGVRWGNHPLVALYHSHSSETYHGRNAHPMGKKDDRLDYAWGQTTGVISVGDELAYILTSKYKVPVIHSRNIHDFPLIREAYSNSLATVTKILQQYPSVVALFDLHRDGLLIAPDSEIAATIGGLTVARVKIVVGKGRPEFPNAHWQKNMAFAEQIQAAMEKRYPGLSRGIQVREWPFNQQVQERALLFEIGDHFNTKEEALRSAVLVADVLAEVLADVVQKQTPPMLRHT